MLKAKFLTKNKQITFEVEGATQTIIFEQFAAIQEIFDSEHKCGVCGSTDLRFLHRKVMGNDFYELICLGIVTENGKTGAYKKQCRARFAFGQIKADKGSLFPKRKDKDGYLPNGGWIRYSPTADAPSQDSNQEPWS